MRKPIGARPKRRHSYPLPLPPPTESYADAQISDLNIVRIRTFLFDGMETFHTRWMVENIAFLMHAAGLNP
jgi:hypothetical protein